MPPGSLGYGAADCRRRLNSADVDTDLDIFQRRNEDGSSASAANRADLQAIAVGSLDADVYATSVSHQTRVVAAAIDAMDEPRRTPRSSRPHAGSLL